MSLESEVFDSLLSRYPALKECSIAIQAAYQLLVECFEHDGFLFTCGNGGSAADADHIVGELQKGFILRRQLPKNIFTSLAFQPDGELLASLLQRGLRAMNLMCQPAIYSAASNDLGGDMGLAQEVCALGRKGDVLLAISTSGNARNIALACQVARINGMRILGLTGAGGGKLAGFADVCIKVPEMQTYKIQELHLPVYHALCMMVEAHFFTTNNEE